MTHLCGEHPDAGALCAECTVVIVRGAITDSEANGRWRERQAIARRLRAITHLGAKDMKALLRAYAEELTK